MTYTDSDPRQPAAPGTWQTAQQQTAEVANTAQAGVQQVAGTAADQAGKVAGEALHQARNLAGEAQQQLTRQVQQQTEQLAGNLRDLSGQFRRMAESGEPGGTATTMLHQLADKGGQAADFLDQRGPGGLLQEMQAYARRKPGTFLLAAAVGGFLVGRLAKGAQKAAQNADETADADGRLPAIPPPYPSSMEMPASVQSATTGGSPGPLR